MNAADQTTRDIARRYPHVVQWSEEDGAYVGSCPPLLYGGCHGDDPAAVLAELREIIGEVVQLYLDDGKPLPDPSAWCEAEAA